MTLPALRHSGPYVLKKYGTTQCYFSDLAPEALVIFVHGFKSKSAATWSYLDENVLASRVFEKADIVFYDYNSLTGNLATEEDALIDCIDWLWKLGSTVAESNGFKLKQPRGPNWRPTYTKLVLVGYSLGGVLVRAAALRSSSAAPQPSWMQSLRLVLFAPAHLGAIPLAGLGQRLGWFGAFRTFLSRSVATFQALTPGCQYLDELQRETEQAYAVAVAAGLQSTLKPRSILFGDRETIVVVGQYAGDPNHAIAPKKKHENVQRSDSQYKRPKRDVEAALR